MRILRMTATFGKLNNATIVLEPGLNILQAENEWGKSTWCAFLMAMFYGLDTRAKSTKAALADKERYNPWSGSPMAGRMDIVWRDRAITIERTTRGRIPMGEFRAYETDTGIVVPELTASNCGQLLLGVEQSVLRRAGFIRFSDLPVTQDEALRRRLNALVTTADESGEGERLEGSLRELKNKCRYNKTGLIPMTQEERSVLENKLAELDTHEKQIQKLNNRLEEISQWVSQLENHRDALRYEQAKEDAQRIRQAGDVLADAQQKVSRLEQICAKLPQREQAEKKLRQLREHQQHWHTLQMELSMVPDAPQCPDAPECFRNLDLEAARQMVRTDTARFSILCRQKAGLLWFLLAAACGAGAAAVAMLMEYWIMAGCIVLALVFLGMGLGKVKKRRQELAALNTKYGTLLPEQWKNTLDGYEGDLQAYHLKMADYRTARGDLDERFAALNRKRQSLCGEQSAEKVIGLWQQVVSCWEEYYDARREALRAQTHLQDLQAMAKQPEHPVGEDPLTYTLEETARLLCDAAVEQQRLQNRLGQYQGRVEALGQREQLRKQYDGVCQRLKKLEDTYAALNLALETLNQAKRELQRRFAPRITKRAQAYMEQLTGGRYTRLRWEEDFGVCAGTGEENVLYSALWRSDGTVDQLYLALRLAVAAELTPDAPLVLDDALVRFDDRRLASALEILSREARQRQILLFTCQGREKAIYEKSKG